METNRAFRTNLSKAVDENKANSREVGWGRVWDCADELTALRIAYSFRHNPKGVQVRQVPSGMFCVTVFSADCADGIDRS
jgi:hypothetical protein